MSDFIEDSNISKAWLKVFMKLLNTTGKEVYSQIVSIDLKDGLHEDEFIKNNLNAELKLKAKTEIETVSSTIFPKSLWNPSGNRMDLYNTFIKIWPKVRKTQANRRGTYFQRLIAFNLVRDQKETKNQLEEIIKMWTSGLRRRSAFQAAILDPHIDQRNSPYQGFPCLQQVAFLPHGNNGTGGLEVVGYYATQAVFEKAYGNYLGLCRLGQFMASQMQLRLIRTTCISSVLKLQNGNLPTPYFKRLENILAPLLTN